MLERPRPWWVLWSLVPFGWLAWIGLFYAGVRARMLVVIALSLPFLAAVIVVFSVADDLAGEISIPTYVAGVGLSLALAPVWQRRMRSRQSLHLDAAEERLEARREALELARMNPELAREAGVGRPDVPGATHGGVIDVNAAPLDVLARLPGIDDRTAAEIVRVREEIDGFSSLADLGAALDLPADTVEDLRGRTVFIPR